MIRMRVRERDRVDVLRIDPGSFQVGKELAGVGPHQLLRSGAGVDQDELVAGIEHERILLELHLVGGRKLSVSVLANSSLLTPLKMSGCGAPRSSGPSDTTVASMAPILNR